MNSKAHSENPLKRVQEFDAFSLTLYGFRLLASEFIPRWTVIATMNSPAGSFNRPASEFQDIHYFGTRRSSVLTPSIFEITAVHPVAIDEQG
jgi:hypothetical protein